MTEGWTEESLDVSSERLSSFVAPREMTNDSAGRRFTVSGLKRVPQKYFPTLAIGAAVVVFTVVMLMVNVLGK
jgi:hypothetical protein